MGFSVIVSKATVFTKTSLFMLCIYLYLGIVTLAKQHRFTHEKKMLSYETRFGYKKIANKCQFYLSQFSDEYSRVKPTKSLTNLNTTLFSFILFKVACMVNIKSFFMDRFY